jgi:response regulator NasT
MSTVLVLADAPHPELRPSLERCGYLMLGELADAGTLHREALRLAPDVIIVTTESPNAKLLESIRSIASAFPRPVVVFATDERREVIRKAVDCGVSAYVVDGWAPERLSAIIEAACARFDAFQAVKHELAVTRTKLSDRKLIEKAKGIVMRERGVTEDEAYSSLRKMAMNQNLPLGEVARRIIDVAELLG